MTCRAFLIRGPVGVVNAEEGRCFLGVMLLMLEEDFRDFLGVNSITSASGLVSS